MKILKYFQTKTKKFNVGDIVEPRFALGHQHAVWNGLRLRITAIMSCYTIEGEVLAAPSDSELARDCPVGKTMSWSNPDVLVIIKEDVAKIKLSDIDKIKLGDIVEVQYAESNWNGIQFRVTEHQPGLHWGYYKGTIVKTTEKKAKSRPVGSEFTWSCSKGLEVVKPKSDDEPAEEPYMKTEEVKIGDVVEVQYGKVTSNSDTWDGIQFRVTECGPHHARGTIIKSPPTRKKSNPVGSEFTWGGGTGLMMIERKDVAGRDDEEEPSPNQVYIDHIYERLVQNATPEELISLAERLDRAGKGISLSK